MECVRQDEGDGGKWRYVASSTPKAMASPPTSVNSLVANCGGRVATALPLHKRRQFAAGKLLHVIWWRGVIFSIIWSMKAKRKNRKKRQLKVKTIDSPAKKAKGSVAKKSGKARAGKKQNVNVKSPEGNPG